MAKLVYKPDRQGMRTLAQSVMVGNACYRAGLAVEAAAKTVPVPGKAQSQVASYRASFDTRRANVTMTKSGETRAGAIVLNDHALEHMFGGRSRALYSALSAIDGVTFS